MAELAVAPAGRALTPTSPAGIGGPAAVDFRICPDESTLVPHQICRYDSASGAIQIFCPCNGTVIDLRTSCRHHSFWEHGMPPLATMPTSSSQLPYKKLQPLQVFDSKGGLFVF
jgi:hypothetical protein